MSDGRTAAESAVQRQARALGDPTRYRIFRHVVESPEPVRVAALTAALGLNHNAVRQHLAKLREAGLIVEERAANSGPGRPPLEYRLAPSVAGRWETPSPYEQLARLLMDLHRGGGSPREVGAGAGRRLDFPKSSRDSLDRLVGWMARHGFEPCVEDVGSGMDIVLGCCPYEALAVTDPDVVCELHLGLAQGIAEAAGGDIEVTQLVAFDPTRAGCRLQTRPGTSTPGRTEAR